MPVKVFFQVTAVARADVRRLLPKHRGKITDDQMEEIARKLGDAYVGSGDFWDDLKIIAEAVLDA